MVRCSGSPHDSTGSNASSFQWLQRMLDHEISEDAAHLEGPYAKAFDRICNQVFFAMGVLQAGMKPYRNEQSQAL